MIQLVLADQPIQKVLVDRCFLEYQQVQLVLCPHQVLILLHHPEDLGCLEVQQIQQDLLILVVLLRQDLHWDQKDLEDQQGRVVLCCLKDLSLPENLCLLVHLQDLVDLEAHWGLVVLLVLQVLQVHLGRGIQ